jgi:hypothetical protein
MPYFRSQGPGGRDTIARDGQSSMLLDGFQPTEHLLRGPLQGSPRQRLRRYARIHQIEAKSMYFSLSLYVCVRVSSVVQSYRFALGGLIYCHRREDCDEIAAKLQSDGIKALSTHHPSFREIAFRSRVINARRLSREAEGQRKGRSTEKMDAE